jgi:mono/diheme cytochrome c family protein
MSAKRICPTGAPIATRTFQFGPPCWLAERWFPTYLGEKLPKSNLTLPTDNARAVKFLGIVAAICLFLLSGCYAPQLSAATGQQVADRWCSDCHGRSGLHPGHFNTSPAETPTFAQIAAYPQVNRQFLEKFFDSIIVMPIYQLSDEEKEEVIDYILSLKPRKEAARLDKHFEKPGV